MRLQGRHLALLGVVGAYVIGCVTPSERRASNELREKERPLASPLGAPRAQAPVEPLPAPPENRKPAAVRGLAPSPTDDVPPIVVLEPKRRYTFPPPTTRPMMDQIATRFTPAAIIVRTGQAADFRNDDDKLHNVRVRERGQPVADVVFNIALQQGITYKQVFSNDGVFDVRCDMHQNMYGLVVSTSSPYAAVSAADGSYAIDEVLPGEYTAVAYTSRERYEYSVTLRPGQQARVDFP